MHHSTDISPDFTHTIPRRTTLNPVRIRAVSGRLRGTSAWREFVAEPLKTREPFDTMLLALSSNDIGELIDIADEEGDDLERRLAMSLLTNLSKRDDKRFSDPLRARWREVLRRRIYATAEFRWTTQDTIYTWARIDADGVEQAFFNHVSQHGIGGRYHHFAKTLLDALTVVPAASRERRAQLFERLVRDQITSGNDVSSIIESWMAFDRPAASRFLTNEWLTDSLDERYNFTLLHGLIRLASKPAKARLLLLRHEPGRLGERATAALELFGILPPAGLNAIVEQWRQTPTREVLQQFYERYIEGMPTGLPVGPWAERMYGRRPEAFAFAITSREGFRLNLELDRRGRLAAYKMSDAP